jgi:hypothetical protein
MPVISASKKAKAGDHKLKTYFRNKIQKKKGVGSRGRVFA